MKYLKYLLPVLLIISLSGCGINHHLRKAKKHLKKAEIKGAIINRDTVFKTITVHTPKIEIDTVFSVDHFRDTITIEKDKVVTRLKIDTVTKEIFVSTECPPDTIEVRVPVSVKTNIKTPRGFWYYAKFFALALIIGFVLGAMFWAAIRAWIRGVMK
jgi:hypothetical protein